MCNVSSPGMKGVGCIYTCDNCSSRFVAVGFLFSYICVIFSYCCIWYKVIWPEVMPVSWPKNNISTNNLEKRRSATVIIEHCKGWGSERPRLTVCAHQQIQIQDQLALMEHSATEIKHCSKKGKTWEFPLLRSRSKIRASAQKPEWGLFYISTK